MSQRKEHYNIIGAHVSIAGGLHNAISIGEKLECQAIQIFLQSPNRWISRERTESEIDQFKTAWQSSGIDFVVGHDSYLTNLASPKSDVLSKSRDLVLKELKLAERLGIQYFVIHLGSHLKSGESEGIIRFSDNLKSLIVQSEISHLTVLLETTAGQGTNLGYKFEQIQKMMNLIDNSERVGVCYDTCHTFAAGYDIRTPESYEKTFREFDSIIGLKKLKLFHINDSKFELNSQRDRHENIGSGKTSLKAFNMLINDKRFRKIPMIIETPGDDKKHLEDLNTLRDLVVY